MPCIMQCWQARPMRYLEPKVDKNVKKSMRKQFSWRFVTDIASARDSQRRISNENPENSVV